MSEVDWSKFDESILEYVPANIARKFCVAPYVRDSSCITLICPDENDFRILNEQQLVFVLGASVKFLPYPRSEVESAISQLYPNSEPQVRNCGIRFSYQCPRTWASLLPTANEGHRRCPDCNKDVHLCDTKEQANELIQQGKCIAYADDNFPGEMYLGYSD